MAWWCGPNRYSIAMAGVGTYNYIKYLEAQALIDFVFLSAF